MHDKSNNYFVRNRWKRNKATELNGRIQEQVFGNDYNKQLSCFARFPNSEYLLYAVSLFYVILNCLYCILWFDIQFFMELYRLKKSLFFMDKGHSTLNIC